MKFFVTLEKFIAQLNLEILSVPGETDKIQISSTEVTVLGFLFPVSAKILTRAEFKYWAKWNSVILTAWTTM